MEQEGEDKTNKHHLTVLGDELDIEPEDMVGAVEGGTINVYIPYNFKDWGFNVKGPINASVEKRDDDNYDVTFYLSGLASGRFYNTKGDTVYRYSGPVEDKTEVMTDEEINDILAKPSEPPEGVSDGMGGMMPPNPMADLGMGGPAAGGFSDTGVTGLTPTG